ncbi:MAG: DNA-3-methyladenine glycosylase, partial [Microbacterium sp.]
MRADLSQAPAPGLVPATRAALEALPVEVAPRLLGGVLEVAAGGATVVVRLTEVEAYHGAGTGEVPDP